jgi:hypothetical protein
MEAGYRGSSKFHALNADHTALCGKGIMTVMPSPWEEVIFANAVCRACIPLAEMHQAHQVLQDLGLGDWTAELQRTRQVVLNIHELIALGRSRRLAVIG